MNLKNEISGIYYILLKDLKAYYFKAPNISWGILFPLVLALAFILRDPTGLQELAPGLVVMAAIFGTTSMEAIVITFEKRQGSLERLLLAPISIRALLAGKIFGGAVFGGVISFLMVILAVVFFGMQITDLLFFVGALVLTLLSMSALGALVAVSVKEVFEAQTLSNFFRFPMVFLCGIFLPVDEMPMILQFIAYLLPPTYSVNAFRLATSQSLTSLAPVVNIIALATYLLFLFAMCELIFKRSLK